jgi:Fis family transcriptional regulator
VGTGVDRVKLPLANGLKGPLARSVERSVSGYLEEMEGQRVNDLYQLVLSQVEAPLIECVLRHTSGNQSLTARILGMSRGTLRKKIKSYDVRGA